MELQSEIENYFASKIDDKFLINLIKTKLNESVFATPEMTLGVGAGETVEGGVNYREFFETVLSSPFVRKLKNNTSFRGRLDIMKKYLDPKSSSEELRTDEFLATFIFLQEFDKIIREYNTQDPRQAGFKFETLMSVLFNGVQINGREITDAEFTEAGEKKEFSFKLLSINERKNISGSLYNFLKMMAEGRPVTYFVGLKDIPNFTFYSFLVQPNNFFMVLKKDSTVFIDLLGNYNSDNGLKGQDLAKSMIEHIDLSRNQNDISKKKTPLSTKNLFDFEFLNAVYVNKQEEQKWKDSDGVSYSFQGDIKINQDIILNAKLAYKDSQLGIVGSLLESVNALNERMIFFFSRDDGRKERTAILNDVDKIKDTFRMVTRK